MESGVPAALQEQGGPRFRAFLAAHQDKIRKKLRTAPDGAGRQDVVAELEVAARLLADRRFELVYEPHAAGKSRGPDFAVSFRVNQSLTLEVTRPRRAAGLANTLCNKAGQLPAGKPSVLVLAGAEVGLPEVEDAARLLKGRAERKDEDYFRVRGYLDARDFLKHFARLSAVCLLGAAPDALWRHNAARYPLPAEMAGALQRCLGALPPAPS